MTGWNLPPGCNVCDIPGCGDEGPCDCCGHAVEDCICPECPVCSEYGRPKCYDAHGLKYTKAQRIGQARMRIHMLREQTVYEELYIAYVEGKPDDWVDED